MQKHLFIVDSLSTLNFKLDSSLRMCLELYKNSQDVFICEIAHLSWQMKDMNPIVQAQHIVFENESIESIKLLQSKSMRLVEFNAIHMRKEPPVEDKFITATWILDAVKNHCWVFNDPTTLRTVNEKMSIFRFPEFTADALVSAHAQQIFQFIENHCNGDAVIKPLNLFGGRGVFRLNLREHNRETSLQKIMEVTHNNQMSRIIQPFNSKIFEGEVRAFAVGGKTVSWCLKVPQSGNFMANTSQGAKLLPYTPCAKNKAMIDTVNQELLALGVYFVGYDVIGNHLSEINITSPRLLVPPLDTYNYYNDIAQWIIGKSKDAPKGIT